MDKVDAKRLKTKRARERAEYYWSLQDFKCCVLGCDYPKYKMQPIDFTDPIYCLPLCDEHYRKFNAIWRKKNDKCRYCGNTNSTVSGKKKKTKGTVYNEKNLILLERW